MFSSNSPVRPDKVSFDDMTTVSMGVKAVRDIPAGSCILSLCGSMSSDTVEGNITVSGYGGYGGGLCVCATCNPTNPPVAKKRTAPPQPQQLPSKKKKPRRTGKENKKPKELSGGDG
ncbi:hypothetical protein PHLCEN_2v5629 [Hermanssonia centrifuga]|uniref:Uncharacterized protein n=1 Tax=Hermanssonia centrifuga TaxID=98765 RepID=A0A2R6P2B5_9APHY|nr:hypothetical protein PHLCEN_2v5629 [Hermanssonia centrifuga]